MTTPEMAPANLTMLDSISLTELEWAFTNHRPDAMAGYVGGNWPTWAPLEHLYANYPGLRLLAVAVFASEDADCLDVETGDATIAQVYGWFMRQQTRKVWKPCVYINASQSEALLATMAANGFARSSFRLWTAHYTAGAHICGPSTCGYPQADGTQWTNWAYGRNLDASMLSPSFFPAPPPPQPFPQPAYTEDSMPVLNGLSSDGRTWTALPIPAGKKHLLLLADQPAVLRIAFGGPHEWEMVSGGRQPLKWETSPLPIPVPPGANRVTIGGTGSTPEPPVTVDWA